MGASCQVAAVCAACWAEAWSETRVCLHQYDVTNVKHVGSLQPELQDAFYQPAACVPATVPLMFFTHRRAFGFCCGSVALLWFVLVIKWKQTAVRAAQMTSKDSESAQV